MKREIVLHVGFDKVGSSSIQTYLSHNNLAKVGSQYRYGVIYPDGGIAIDRLNERAKKNPLGYVSSYPNLAVDVDLEVLKDNLDDLFDKGIVPIFSSEGWARRAKEFKDNNIFEVLDVHAVIVFYIRPQANWLNSAWWQWFNWHPNFKTPQDYFNKVGKNAANWNAIIDRWVDIPNIKEIKVRLQGSDIVSDFLSIFDIVSCSEALEKSRSNVSLPPEIIKLLCHYPDLRGVHDSHIDNKLTKVFNFDGEVPWVINKQLLSLVINNFTEPNLKLLDRLSDDQKKSMRDDRRWWDKNAYNDKLVSTTEDLVLSNEDKDKILRQALVYIIENGSM